MRDQIDPVEQYLLEDEVAPVSTDTEDSPKADQRFAYAQGNGLLYMEFS